MPIFVNSAWATYCPNILFVERSISSITISKQFILATYTYIFQIHINGMKNSSTMFVLFVLLFLINFVSPTFVELFAFTTCHFFLSVCHSINWIVTERLPKGNWVTLRCMNVRDQWIQNTLIVVVPMSCSHYKLYTY